MTEREHQDITERLKAAEEKRYAQQLAGYETPRENVGRGLADVAPVSSARDAIRSEINRLTGRIEELKALDRCLPKELSPMAEAAVRSLVLGSVR
jgi:hypothetical protein